MVLEHAEAEADAEAVAAGCRHGPVRGRPRPRPRRPRPALAADPRRLGGRSPSRPPRKLGRSSVRSGPAPVTPETLAGGFERLKDEADLQADRLRGRSSVSRSRPRPRPACTRPGSGWSSWRPRSSEIAGRGEEVRRAMVRRLGEPGDRARFRPARCGAGSSSGATSSSRPRRSGCGRSEVEGLEPGRSPHAGSWPSRSKPSASLPGSGDEPLAAAPRPAPRQAQAARGDRGPAEQARRGREQAATADRRGADPGPRGGGPPGLLARRVGRRRRAAGPGPGRPRRAGPRPGRTRLPTFRPGSRKLATRRRRWRDSDARPSNSRASWRSFAAGSLPTWPRTPARLGLRGDGRGGAAPAVPRRRGGTRPP